MDVDRLQQLIALAIAEMVRAQQQAAPVLDHCLAGMVDDDKRAQLRAARFELARASVYASAASQRLQNASAMLAEFLKPQVEV